MINSPLEFLAQRYENVVKHDVFGNIAGIFVKFPKMISYDLNHNLPEHTHPAFIINGVEQDYILLGKYIGGANGESDGAIVSLPNIEPANNATADDLLSRMKKAGSGITGMTCADYGFLKLLAQKNGWSPNGNTDNGAAYNEYSSWKIGEVYDPHTFCTFEGNSYECLRPHSAKEELKPSIAARYWSKKEFVGGVCHDSITLNGTGPLNWYLGEDAGNMADLVGNVSEIQYGYRIVNGEIQILENNNAADPLADLSKDSPEWRAILPDSSDEGYTLVDPGTSGTLHWNGSQLGTEVPQDTIQSKIIKFTAITTSSALTKIPCIMYELGLIPIKLNYGPDETDGYCSLAMLGEEMLSSRGGHYTSEDYAGLGSVSTASRNSADVRRGCRPRSL